MKKNEVYETEIIDYATNGNGICKIDGMTVFVPNAAVGDKVRVKILKVNKNYAFGKIEEISASSSDRITPDCGIFNKCGGCIFRHISYKAELAFKQKRVSDALTRIGGVDGNVIENIIPSDKVDRYRNKAQLPITADKDGIIRVGFFAPGSHRVIPLDDCMLQSPSFTPAIDAFLVWANAVHIKPYDEQTHTGILRHLYLRYAEETDELMVCIIANAKELRKEKMLVSELVNRVPNLKTVILNTNEEKTNVIMGKLCRTLYGDGYITDKLCGMSFRISPLSFYQVNRTMAEKLYTAAAELAALKPDDILMDMYCGTGTIGLTMANHVKKLIGIEIIPQAIDDANTNSIINKITNAEFICGDAAKAAELLRKRGETPDCIVLDPPRKGCDNSLIDTAAKMFPAKIVYISCDPATLARDIKIFCEKGYTVQKAIPVDLFPRTGHVETVCLMSKVKEK